MNNNEIMSMTNNLFEKKFNVKCESVISAPGRINIIGEHLDYNNGISISCAIDRWVCIGASIRKDNKIIIYSDKFDSELILDTDLNNDSSLLWHRYAIGSLKVFNNVNKISSGMNIFINSNIPIGSGLSSSAAFEIALLSSYFKLFNIKFEKKEIAMLSQKIEHDYLNINSGMLDQISSIYSKKDNLILIDFRDNSHEYIFNTIKGASFIAVNSMIKRELADSQYIQRVKECQKGYSLLGVNKIEIIMDSDLKELDSYPLIKKRFSHIISEYQRVRQMEQCIHNNNVIDIGRILKDSHKSLKNDYEVSCREIDFLIDSSYEFSGWHGGRIMGGGFGGCTINLVKDSLIPEYINFIKRNYKREFNLELECYNLKMVESIIS